MAALKMFLVFITRIHDFFVSSFPYLSYIQAFQNQFPSVGHFRSLRQITNRYQELMQIENTKDSSSLSTYGDAERSATESQRPHDRYIDLLKISSLSNILVISLFIFIYTFFIYRITL